MSSAPTQWTTYRYYYGSLVGYHYGNMTVNPIQNRAGSWTVFEGDEWVGETFGTLEEAKSFAERARPLTPFQQGTGRARHG